MSDDDLIERLRLPHHSYCTDVSADACKLCRERSEAADALEAQQAEIERLERDLLALTDTHDPVARGGHCMFCHHPIGLSVFGIDMHANELHYEECLWIARRQTGMNQHDFRR